MKRLLLLALFLSCESPTEPLQDDREQVWLYPEDVLETAVIGNRFQYISYFDLPHADYERRRVGWIWQYRFSDTDSVFFWGVMGSGPCVYDENNPLFNKLALGATHTLEWEYIYFEWDTE